MILKDASVNVTGLREPISNALDMLDIWHQRITNQALVITSGAEWIKHSVPRSAHYRGDAVDIRNWYLKEIDSDLDRWAAEIRGLLGVDFVVINEGTHFHIHWAPFYQGS